MKQPATIYVVTPIKPEGVFYQKDIAETSAANLAATTEEDYQAFPIQVTTKNVFRKAAKAAVLDTLTSDQKVALGLVKTPRAKRSKV